MKSLFRFTALALLSAVMFFSCATSGVSDVAEKMTPENSVVMIFVSFSTSRDYEMVQINPAYSAGKSKIVAKNGGATGPLVPGACYMIYYSDFGKLLWTGAPSITDSISFAYLNGSQTDRIRSGRKIEVPSKPGLYVYYPEMDIDAIKNSGGIVIGKLTNDMDEWHKIPMYRKTIQKCFIKAAKAYAGTEWEPLIEEYVEEWSE